MVCIYFDDRNKLSRLKIDYLTDILACILIFRMLQIKACLLLYRVSLGKEIFNIQKKMKHFKMTFVKS